MKYILLFLVLLTAVENFKAEIFLHTDWKYRRQIRISTTTVKLPYYQIFFSSGYITDLIKDGKIQSDWDDIRFTDSDGVSLLNYWIHKTTFDVKTGIYIRVPYISPGKPKIIYLYYSNPNASSYSNGNTTFDFFDDFTDHTLNTAKWILTGHTDDFILTDGKLKGLNTRTAVRSRTIFSYPAVLETRATIPAFVPGRSPGAGPLGFMIAGFFNNTKDHFGLIARGGNDQYLSDGTPSLIDFDLIPTNGDWFILNIHLADPTTVKYSVRNLNTGSTSPVLSIRNTVRNEHIAIGTHYHSEIKEEYKYEAYWDYIFVRKYASPAPAILPPLGPEEKTFIEAMVLPEISTTVVSGSVKVDIPQGAFLRNTTFYILNLYKLPISLREPYVPFIAYEFKAKDTETGQEIRYPDSPVKISFMCKSTDGIYIDNTDPKVKLIEDLSIAFWDGDKWQLVTTKVERTTYSVTVSGVVKYLAKYGVVVKPKSGIPEIIVQPNPFTPLGPDGNFSKVNFIFANPDMRPAELKIYDVQARLIRTIPPKPTAMLYWDGYDDKNNICESGPYIYQLRVGKKVYKGVIILAK